MEAHTKKLISSVIFLAVLFIGLVAVLVLVKQRQVIQKKAAGGTATMTLIPSTVTVNAGQDFTIDVNVNSQTVPVSGVDVIVDYSAGGIGKISLKSIVPQNNIINQTNATNLMTYVPILTDGTFDFNTVKTKADTTGIVEFGAVAFQYRPSDPPTPIPSPTTIPSNPINAVSIAKLTFTANTAGTFNIITKVDAANPTTDTNIVDTNAADIWNQASSTTSVTINAATTPTPTVTPTGVVPTVTPTVTNAPTPTPTTPAPTVTPTTPPVPTATPVVHKRDINGDGVVNGQDLSTLIIQPYPCTFGTPDPFNPACTGSNSRDINGDGVVNGQDLSTLILQPYPCTYGTPDPFNPACAQ